jgi:hypothetical protein
MSVRTKQTFNLNDVAKLIGVSRNTIVREVARGAIKASLLPPTKMRVVWRQDLVDYLANRPGLHFALAELVGPMPEWEAAITAPLPAAKLVPVGSNR